MANLDTGLPGDFLERVVPQGVRTAFERERLLFALEEMNCLGDRLRFCHAHGHADEAEAVRAQLRIFLESVQWTAETARRVAWELAMRAPYRHPEDAFSPAVVLGTVETDANGLRAWMAALPADSRAELAKTPDVLPTLIVAALRSER